MSLRWFSKRAPQIDPAELNAAAETSLQKTQEQQPHVNALVTYLENRKGQNGFGEDFEITIRNPRRA